jgi:glutamine amidotransferase
MIALIDYGAGNVRSVYKALTAVGADVTVTQEAAVVLVADKVVLPGVGAFGDCMASLDQLDLIPSIRAVVARGTLFLGICVGMQVLFDEGTEMEQHTGLGLLPGRVVHFRIDPALKVPHTGWNQVMPAITTPLLADLPIGAWTYFNHGYYCQAKQEHILAVTDYGGMFPCVVGHDNVFGIQFHPEKSQHIGLHILRNFVGM